MSWARIIYSCVGARNLIFFPSLKGFFSLVTCVHACLRSRNWRESFFKRNKPLGDSPDFRNSGQERRLVFREAGACRTFSQCQIYSFRFIHSAWKISGWPFAGHQSSVIRTVRNNFGYEPKLNQSEFRPAFPLSWVGTRKAHFAWSISATADCCVWANILLCMSRRQHLGIQHLASSGGKQSKCPHTSQLHPVDFQWDTSSQVAKLLPKMAYKILDHTEVLYEVLMRFAPAGASGVTLR